MRAKVRLKLRGHQASSIERFQERPTTISCEASNLVFDDQRVAPNQGRRHLDGDVLSCRFVQRQIPSLVSSSQGRGKDGSGPVI